LDICANDYAQDWKLGVAGGPDFWVHAEEFLAKKRSDKSISLWHRRSDISVTEFAPETQFCDLKPSQPHNRQTGEY
jgi:hypothetical protein